MQPCKKIVNSIQSEKKCASYCAQNCGALQYTMSPSKVMFYKPGAIHHRSIQLTYCVVPRLVFDNLSHGKPLQLHNCDCKTDLSCAP